MLTSWAEQSYFLSESAQSGKAQYSMSTCSHINNNAMVASEISQMELVVWVGRKSVT